MKLELDNPRFFQDEYIPKETSLCGYSALVHALGVEAPVRTPACVASHHIKGSIREDSSWRIFDRRYACDATVESHLSFALRNEPVDLLLLKRIFEKTPQQVLEDMIMAAPTGATSRKIWFLWEFLLGKNLNIDEAPKVAAVDLLDENEYFTSTGEFSRRHRVRDNLLGTADFCPIVRKTARLQQYIEDALSRRAKDTIGRFGNHLIARAASFMLLADSQASFQIEGEHPPRTRLERWGKAILQSGRMPLSAEEIIRLHTILIQDNRFVKTGFRDEGVFLGERDTDGNPLPEFIGAAPSDIDQLIAGLVQCDHRMKNSGIDPVVQAAVTAFGFVYIHPFFDGNGRVHRCLIHHVLTERQFSPPGMVFPVSSVMLDRIEVYRSVLQNHSRPLMQCIDWVPTAKRNVDVTNPTADLYRYFDCTEAAEFLYACVEKTVLHDLPHEIDYLNRHDMARSRVMNIVEMPDSIAEDFIMFTRRNGGTLPKKRRTAEFAQLTDAEIGELEQVVRDIFELEKSSQAPPSHRE